MNEWKSLWNRRTVDVSVLKDGSPEEILLELKRKAESAFQRRRVAPRMETRGDSGVFLRSLYPFPFQNRP